MKLYMFQTVPQAIITSFSLYTQQWYMSYRCACEQDQDETILILLASCQQICMTYTSLQAESGWNHPDPARKLSENLYDIYHRCVYSEKLLMMDRGTVRNM